MNVLYDGEQNKYVSKASLEESRAVITTAKDDAWVFSDQEVDLAWQVAYKCAWLGLGQFYVFAY